MKELRTEIEIQAPAERVWQVLTDLDHYADWNPFIQQAVGEAKPGNNVDVTVGVGARERTLHCQVVKVEPIRELRWRYAVGLPALFSGEHSFTLEPIDASRVRFVDREVFSGLLVPLQARDIDTNTRRGFEAMDSALKAQAERR